MSPEEEEQFIQQYSPPRKPSWDAKSYSSVSSYNSQAQQSQEQLTPIGRYSRTNSRGASPPPFGLDADEVSASSRATTASNRSRGYRNGGPKEARLKRVAFLSMVKEVDHLHPVKSIWRDWGYLYPNRFTEQDAVDKLLQAEAEANGQRGNEQREDEEEEEPLLLRNSNSMRSLDSHHSRSNRSLHSSTTVHIKTNDHRNKQVEQEVIVSPLSRQKSFFSRGTGYHGICNIPIEEGYQRNVEPVRQSISLKNAMSRSGYPWSSVRELKYLPLHPPVEAIDGFTLKVENVPKHFSDDEIRQEFERYGPVLSVSCPKPLLVSERTNDPNCGIAFIKFEDRRDMERAQRELQDGRIIFDHQQLSIHTALPHYWPTERTRRYY